MSVPREILERAVGFAGDSRPGASRLVAEALAAVIGFRVVDFHPRLVRRVRRPGPGGVEA